MRMNRFNSACCGADRFTCVGSAGDDAHSMAEDNDGSRASWWLDAAGACRVTQHLQTASSKGRCLARRDRPVKAGQWPPRCRRFGIPRLGLGTPVDRGAAWTPTGEDPLRAAQSHLEPAAVPVVPVSSTPSQLQGAAQSCTWSNPTEIDLDLLPRDIVTLFCHRGIESSNVPRVLKYLHEFLVTLRTQQHCRRLAIPLEEHRFPARLAPRPQRVALWLR